ncbi:MAG: efflux RND transporter periplasmic adaptor subunit [Opitutaceae bacterium]|nr:efflux RND transporter periplasmic adaptor subunit [Opitutaceae bacterium]
MIKRLAPWFVLVLAAAAVFIWWRRTGTSTAATLTYRTATVRRGDVTQTVTGSGTLSALTTVDVGTQVSGQIWKIYADYNDTVQEGQLLAEIEPSTYEARLFQAEADLLSTQAALGLKQLNVKRATELLAKTLVSQADFDQAAAELRQQDATAKKAEAAVKSARVDLERCRIYSPVNGVVLKRAIDVGQTVQASFSAPVLFTIAQDLRQMEISASISEADIGNVEAGQSVTFTVDAFPGRTFEGRVRQVRNDSTISNNVVTYPTIVSADNADLKLRPGMTANIDITTSRRTNVLRVPNAALRFKAPDGATVVAAAANRQASQFDQMPAEIEQRRLARFDANGDGKLDDDESKEMEASMRNRLSANNSDGGFGVPGAGGGPVRADSPSSSSSTTSQPVTLHLVMGQPNAAGHATGTLQAVHVFAGVSDSTNTEILSGIEEGAVVATGTVSAQAAAVAAAATSGTNNIFGPPRRPGSSRSR